MVVVGTITFYFLIPSSRSLKEKRGIIRPFIHRLQREFNVSVAEIEKLNNHSETVIACAMISNNKNCLQQQLNHILEFENRHCKDLQILDYSIEIY